MTTTRTYEELRQDLAELKDHTQANLPLLSKTGQLDSILALTSRAEAKLDAHALWPKNPGDRLGDAYKLITRAWLRINSPSSFTAK